MSLSGKIALAYEATLLGMSETAVMDEMIRRYEIMKASVIRGLDPNFQGLQLLPTCAGKIFEAEAAGKLATQSLHTRAAARALAVMHVDAAMGVVCSADRWIGRRDTRYFGHSRRRKIH